jgi:hypothetical protein
MSGQFMESHLSIAADIGYGGSYSLLENSVLSLWPTNIQSHSLTADSWHSHKMVAVTHVIRIQDLTREQQDAAYSVLQKMHKLDATIARFLYLPEVKIEVWSATGSRNMSNFSTAYHLGYKSRACYLVNSVKAAQHILQLCHRYSPEKLFDTICISCNLPSLSLPRLRATSLRRHFEQMTI